jgi:hypothetical protein
MPKRTTARNALQHAAAPTLVGWYLMEPPFKMLPNGTYDAVIDAPLSNREELYM